MHGASILSALLLHVISCLEADYTVHLIQGSAAATSASATNVVNPNANQDAPMVGFPTTGGLFVRVSGGPLFSGLGSRGGSFGAGLPDFEQDLLNLNPELSHIFNDPAIFLQTWEAARTNPLVALLGDQEQGKNRSTNPPATGSDTTANPLAPNSNPLSDPWAPPDFGGAQMNTAPRSNASRNILGPSPGGLDDIADLQRMLGGIPGASSENQLIGYPSISQIMQHINQIMGLDPNSHRGDMMPNPELIHQLMSSKRMQEYLVQQGLFPYLDQPQSNQSLDYIGFFDSEEALIAVEELEEDSGE
nr:ubiquitin domain-containing protein DSK2a-like [Solanum lycopersicum]